MIKVPFQFEVAAMLADEKLISYSKGTAGEVTFEFFDAWDYYKKHKFKTLFMIHVHPDGCPNKSSMDDQVIAGWMKAFPDVKIYFVVLTKGEDNKVTGNCYLCYNKQVTLVAKPVYLQHGYSSSEWLTLNLIYWSCGNEEMPKLLQQSIDGAGFKIFDYRTVMRLI